MNKELEAFTYVSSHDMQEPLRKIQTFASLILEKENANLSEKGKDFFRLMQESAERMRQLIHDLLAFSRISADERIFVNTELQGIVDDVKIEFKEKISAKHAIIELKASCDVRIIPFQFRQLMHNLIGNALKFSSPERSPRITITCENFIFSEADRLKMSLRDAYVHICVEDNGIGFDKEFNNRIFEVFQKLHGKEEYEGTGIGLAIVKKIVDNHEGLITASGEVNRGAKFDIYIPAIPLN